MRTLTMLFFCFILFSCNNKEEVNPLVERVVVITDTGHSHEHPPPPPPQKMNDSDATEKNIRPRASDNEHWKKKKAEGVDFMVIGNEPFWNLEVRNLKSLKFHLSDWEEPVEIPFTGKVESGKFNEVSAKDIEVRIVPEECSDGMSDFGYDYSVLVTYKGVLYKGCGIAL